jgi:hypothetical protein
MVKHEVDLLEALYRAVHAFLVAELKLSGPPSTSLGMDDASRRYWQARGHLIEAHDAIADARPPIDPATPAPAGPPSTRSTCRSRAEGAGGSDAAHH